MFRHLVPRSPRWPARPAACLLALVLVAPLLPLAAQAGEKAHRHGQAQLDVGVEGRKLVLRFSSPLDNLVGFEHAPRDEKERQRVDVALAKLRAAGTLFAIDPVAQCTLSAVELTSRALRLGQPDSARGKDASKPEHADLDADFEFDCTDAAQARYIEVNLFEFKRLHRLDVQVAGPHGQFKRSLKPAARRLSLVR